jgi:hypothetical protein
LTSTQLRALKKKYDEDFFSNFVAFLENPNFTFDPHQVKYLKCLKYVENYLPESHAVDQHHKNDKSQTQGISSFKWQTHGKFSII